MFIRKMQPSVSLYMVYLGFKTLARGAVFVQVKAVTSKQGRVVFCRDAEGVAPNGLRVTLGEVFYHGIKHIRKWRLYTYYII